MIKDKTARKLKKEVTDKGLKARAVFLYISATIFIILGLPFLLLCVFIGILFILLGLFMIHKARYYQKVANTFISIIPERENNCVLTIDGNSVEWLPTLYVNDFLEVDEINKKFAIFEPEFDNTVVCILNYDDLLSYELLENESLLTTRDYGVFSSMYSESIYGEGQGAIVGSNIANSNTRKQCESLKIKVNTKLLASEPIYINLIKYRTSTDTNKYEKFYREAQEILSIFEKIEYEIKENEIGTLNISDVNKIKEFKSLLDEGIITEEEFISKKKQLLNI